MSTANTHIRVMRTVNPEPGQGAWAVTRVHEHSSNGKMLFGKLEFIKDSIASEQLARHLRFKLMVERGVFEFG